MGPIYIDGTCSTLAIRHLAVALGGAIQLTRGGRVHFCAAQVVPKHMKQSAASAEHVGMLLVSQDKVYAKLTKRSKIFDLLVNLEGKVEVLSPAYTLPKGAKSMQVCLVGLCRAMNAPCLFPPSNSDF